jgi:inorganic pyrophosphatase
MDENPTKDSTWELMRLLFKAHPWHGVSIGADAPGTVTAFIEIVPTDTVKYEIDKPSGHLKVDRPQTFSNVCPTLYGFVPQTYCGERVAAYSQGKTGLPTLRGDADPLDICVLSEKTFSHGDILLQAIPIGGLRLLDKDEADDKIIAVLKGDAAYGEIREVADLPRTLVDRLRHYFLTYKRPPGATGVSRIPETPIADGGLYGRAEACEVIERSREDYQTLFPDLRDRFLASLRNG